MGRAPKIIEGIRRTKEQIREEERKWFLDTQTGEMKPEEDPAEEPNVRPQPIQVAHQTFD